MVAEPDIPGSDKLLQRPWCKKYVYTKYTKYDIHIKRL